MHFFDFHHHHPDKRPGIYNLEYKEDIPESLFSAGIHPAASLEDIDQKIGWVELAAKMENCMAVGECGLDALCGIDKEIQIKCFEMQILLANELQKPLIIHCVRWFPDLIRICKMAKVPVIIHGFNKRKTIGYELLLHGFYLSFGKSLLFNVPLQEFLKNMPAERILLETDNSDITPEEIYDKASSIRNISKEKMVEIINKNLQELKILP